MKFLTHQIMGLLALPLLVLVFGLLLVLTLRSTRGSRLYRLRVALLGLIVTLWGGWIAGCSERAGVPDQGQIECYAPIVDLSVDDDWAPDPLPDPTCYVPPDPRQDWEIPPDAVDSEAQDLDAADLTGDDESEDGWDVDDGEEEEDAEDDSLDAEEDEASDGDEDEAG